MDDLTLKLILTVVVIAIALAAGLPTLAAQRGDFRSRALGWGEAFAAGVFLGAGLIHMLGDADGDFAAAGLDYPYAPMLCGATMLLLLWLEHFGQRALSGDGGTLMPAMAAAMLSLHSLLTGAAFGVSSTVAVTLVIFLAVLAHKGAASFALALELRRGTLERRRALSIFLVFVVMFPVGVAIGQSIEAASGRHPLVEPVFGSLAAGTFLFFGTLHGLASSPMIARCCNFREFVGALAGFCVMAVVAIWT